MGQNFRLVFFAMQVVEWHVKGIAQVLCSRMKKRLKDDEM
jgi:hypothetical protein